MKLEKCQILDPTAPCGRCPETSWGYAGCSGHIVQHSIAGWNELNRAIRVGRAAIEAYENAVGDDWANIVGDAIQAEIKKGVE
jgi:hypothetical protein